MTIGDFAQAMLAYCAVFDGSVTSWIRTQRRNSAVGGMDLSYHMTGLAADVVYDDGPPQIERVQRLASQLGLYVHREHDHDHVRAA